VPLPWRADNPVDVYLENESSLAQSSDSSSFSSSSSSFSSSSSGCTTPEWVTASSSEPTSLGQSLGHVTRASDVKTWADDDNTELW
jgi:hypothetical protein